MQRKSKKTAGGPVRNPDRTRRRILAAAVTEFAAKGQAGARVDAIARRAGTNKRMLYHYFTDKEGLYRAVLRAKITERRTQFEAAPGDPSENLAFRFDLMCHDREWIRLLGWEALESQGGRVEEEQFRRKGLVRALERLRGHQAAGHLTDEHDRRHLLLAKIALTVFPIAFPQMTRLVTGLKSKDPKFEREYRNFLKKFGTNFSSGASTPETKLWPDMKLLFQILIVAALGCLAAGCSPGKAAKGGAGVPVITAKAGLTNMPVLVDPAPVGHVLPVSSVAIRAQIGGIISTVEFQEGQEVKKGDLLFTLDPRPEQAALVQAQANLQRDAAQLDNSKIQFDREQKLFDSKLVSQDEYETSRAAFDALVGTVAGDRAAITNAGLNLEFTQIRSPVDGRTGSIQFREGNVVKSPDDVLLTINQIHPIYVAFAVAESFLPEIQKQMRDHTLRVKANFEGMVGTAPTGELTFVDNTVDTSTGTILLKATFPNADDKLWPGQFVKVSMRLDELTNAVVVPTQAVQTGQNGDLIYVVKDDMKVEARAVKTGITDGNSVVISSGIKAGETVVTDGQLRLAPDVLVSDKARTATNAPAP